MRVRLQLRKENTPIFQGTYDVTDADTFGKACADAFAQLRTKELNQTPSVGAMMDMLDQNALDVLDGASIVIDRA